MAELEQGQAPESEIYKEAKRPFSNSNPVLSRVLQRDDKISEVTPEDTSQTTITRREFGRLMGTLALLLGTGAAWWAKDNFNASYFLSPEFGGREDDTNKKEVHLLYLFNEPNSQSDNDRKSALAKDLAIAATGRNKYTKEPIDFLNYSTWKDFSDLENLKKAFNKLFEDITTPAGRAELKQRIIKYEGENREYYLLRLKKLEDYLQKKQLPFAVSEDDLRTFFMASSGEGGLGYREEDTALIFDLLKASRANQFTPELKGKINQINEKSGTRFRIP